MPNSILIVICLTYWCFRDTQNESTDQHTVVVVRQVGQKTHY